MGFISYSLNYYIDELQKIESISANAETVYRAKQLLKMLDDLLDEGYTELNEALESTCQGVSRLRKFLYDNNAEPFSTLKKSVSESEMVYEREETELIYAINELVTGATKNKTTTENPFLASINCFCNWIGYEEDTAYIFLLRDTLLPYIHYQAKNRTRIYPWLLGRKTLEAIAGKECIDDEIRASIINALEIGDCEDYNGFCRFVLKDIRNTLINYPKIEKCFVDLLSEIKENHIVVVESGCSGTFPMMLKSLDDRVDFRMYTTYPYLLNIYGDRIYSKKYEENRLFETLCSQDSYFQFSSLRDNSFYVTKCLNEEIKKNAFAETKSVICGG